MRINKTLNLVMSVIFTITFFLLLATNASAATYGQPGDHCGATADPACRSDLVCLYNACAAKAFAPCISTADCVGTATNLMACYNGQCFGRHAYPCGDVREDPICLHNPADLFHCDISGTVGFSYCESEHYASCGDEVINQPSETCELPNSINNDYCPQNDAVCLGTKLGTRDDYGNCDASCGCVEDPFNYFCAKGQCGAECSVNADCAPKCVGNVFNYGGSCGENSCACSYSSENCDLKDGWYNTTSTRWINDSVCKEKEQKQQKYRDYSCVLPSGCTYSELESRWIETGNKRNKADGTICNDGLFCTTPDVCTNGICGGTTKDCSDNLFCTINESCDEVNDRCTSDQKSCSAFNISSIATCDNNPDLIHFTWDYRSWFTSVCDENNDKCTSGNENISHSCDIDKCGAECEVNADCDDGNVHTTDYCVSDCTCKHDDLPYCGDNIINVAGEVCELPSTSNNAFCSQTTTGTCNGKKIGTRDAFGNCNSECGCTPDEFNYQCVPGQCGAECNDDSDCNDGNIHTTDSCNMQTCGCEHQDLPYCGNGIINVGENCELPSTSNNAFCSQTNNTCSGFKLGVRDLFGNCNAACGCAQDDFIYSCVKNECGATCSVNSDCADYCEGDFKHFSKTCDLTTSCSCTEGQSFNCSSLDGWFDTNQTQWISTGACTEKQQKKQEYKDYACTSTTAVDCTFTVSDNRWVNTTNTRNKNNRTSCDDGLFCTDNDVCTEGECGGTSRTCSGFNISGIETCDNNPDGNHFTWDFRNYFTSMCDEENDKCTEGSFNITHTCDIETCGAECIIDSDCDDQNIFTTDVCLANCSCRHDTQPYCGDNIIQALLGEKCEMPNTLNNINCPQAPATSCEGLKLGVRDAYGDCNSQCGCKNDTFTFSCVKDQCGAACSVNSDCNDNNYLTIDTCLGNCTCFHKWLPYCGDGNKTKDEECDDGNNNNGDGCDENCTLEKVALSGSSSGGSSRRSGGGGGGSGSSISSSTWTCTEWDACANGKQERTCTQASISKTETQDCVAKVVSNNNVGTVSLTIDEASEEQSADAPVETEELSENVAANMAVNDDGSSVVEDILGMNSITGSVIGSNPSGKIVITGAAFLVLGGLLLLFAFIRR